LAFADVRAQAFGLARTSLACPSVGRLRGAHAGAGMLAVAAPVGAWQPRSSHGWRRPGRDMAREIRL